MKYTANQVCKILKTKLDLQLMLSRWTTLHSWVGYIADNPDWSSWADILLFYINGSMRGEFTDCNERKIVEDNLKKIWVKL